MFFLLGLALIVGSVALGFAPQGKLALLWRPWEFAVLFGVAAGSFMIANNRSVIARALADLVRASFSDPPSKRAHLQLLTLLWAVFRLAQSQGPRALAAHVEAPEKSSLFAAFPAIAARPMVLGFLCDHMRALALDGAAPAQLDAVMAEEIETLREEAEEPVRALESLADAMPAFGIVAAVMGVILAMSDVEQPPAALGGLIAGALCGTFLGVLTSYGLIGPAAAKMRARMDLDLRALDCARIAIAAYAGGASPGFAVEAGRKGLAPAQRPSWKELERITSVVDRNRAPAAPAR